MNLKPLAQDEAWQTLEAMASGGPLSFPGAVIFLGTEGVGKKRTARALFQALHCELGFEVCGKCRSCLLVSNGNHVDLVELAPRGQQIPVEELRETLAKNAFRPYDGKVRMILIDQAHRLGLSAANVLLKALEEPPPFVKYILVTHERAQLLPTIISRCQFVYFRPLDETTVLEIAERNQVSIPSDLKSTFLALLNGGVARLSALSQPSSLELLSKFRQLLKATGRRRPWQEIAKFADEISALSDDQWDALFSLAILECHRNAALCVQQKNFEAAFRWSNYGLDFNKLGVSLERNANKKLVALQFSEYCANIS